MPDGLTIQAIVTTMLIPGFVYLGKLLLAFFERERADRLEAQRLFIQHLESVIKACKEERDTFNTIVLEELRKNSVTREALLIFLKNHNA